VKPFDYLNAINHTKENLIVDDITEREYPAFLINRSLSYFADTVAYANAINQYHHVDKKLQNDFLLNIVRKRKRFSKWFKPTTQSDIEAVKEYYCYSNEKARQALSLLSPEQLQQIKKKVSKGGKRNCTMDSS